MAGISLLTNKLTIMSRCWILLALLIAACGISRQATEGDAESMVTIVPPEGMVMVWVQTDPVQCLENPWEQWWMIQHPEEEYPKGLPRSIESAEQAIIIEFFSKTGVIIGDVLSIPYPEDAAICDACTCPDGYTLYLQIPEDKVDFMSRQFNFQLADAPK